MPRIYDAYSEPRDFCKRHFPAESAAVQQYGKGEGPDGRGNCFAWDAEHPPYEDSDNYECEACGIVLTGEDN